MHDRYRNRYRVPTASDRLRRQIALEAARRLYGTLIPAGKEPPPDWLDAASPNDLYVAKRKAAAVLGHRIRPGDLPSDAEVREQVIALQRESDGEPEPADAMPEPDARRRPAVARRSSRSVRHLQDASDAARIGQAKPQISSRGGRALSQPAGLPPGARRPSLRRRVSARRASARRRQGDRSARSRRRRRRGPARRRHRAHLLADRASHGPARRAATSRFPPGLKRELESSEYFDDLKLLRELDDAGRVPGQHVDSIDEVLAYLKGLEDESYLDV